MWFGCRHLAAFCQAGPEAFLFVCVMICGWLLFTSQAVVASSFCLLHPFLVPTLHDETSLFLSAFWPAGCFDYLYPTCWLPITSLLHHPIDPLPPIGSLGIFHSADLC